MCESAFNRKPGLADSPVTRFHEAGYNPFIGSIRPRRHRQISGGAHFRVPAVYQELEMRNVKAMRNVNLSERRVAVFPCANPNLLVTLHIYFSHCM